MKKIFSFITLFSVLALTGTVHAETMPVPEIEGLVIVNDSQDSGSPAVEEAPLINVSIIPEIINDEVVVDEETVDVAVIDIGAPIISAYPYDAVTPTQSLTVRVRTVGGTLNTDTHVFTENGTFLFMSTSPSGMVSLFPVTITNIDRTAPVITIGEYNTATTTGPITVTATTNEEEATLNATSHTFTENGSFTFTATDIAGNVATPVTVTITNIQNTSNNGGGGSTGGGFIGSYPRPYITGTGLTQNGQVLGAEKFKFSKQMFFGDQHEEVTELQKVLISLGLLKIKSPTGYFGPLTTKAVRAYQVAHGIRSTGNVGPLTLAELNK